MTRREILAGLAAFPFEREIRSAELRMSELINDDRSRAGLPRLEWSEVLADAARSQSTRMMVRGFFGHRDPEYGELQKRLEAAGIGWSHCAENIFHASGWQEPGWRAPLRLADISWMTSPGHQANILLDSVTLTGVGIAHRPPEDWFLTQIFIAPPIVPVRRNGEWR